MATHGPFCGAEFVAAVGGREEPAVGDLVADVVQRGGFADGEVVEELCAVLWEHARLGCLSFKGGGGAEQGGRPTGTTGSASSSPPTPRLSFSLRF